MYEPLVTAQQMRAFDHSTINMFGIPGVVLMENAGRSTFLEIYRRFECQLSGLKAAVIAGPGNNGGDGFVIARYLINHKANVRTYLVSPISRIKGDALVNLNILLAMGGSVIELKNPEDLLEASGFWRECGLVVDSILGTGLQSDVRSPIKEILDIINECPGFTVAVDIPSGVDSDTGQLRGCAVRADLTMTYGFRKLGMAIYPGKRACGEIEVVDISIPASLVNEVSPKARLVDHADIKSYFQLRQNPVTHKGSFGHVLVVGGSPGKTGAVAMAARAASRIGAGLVTVATPEKLNPILENKLTEEMTVPVSCDGSGQWNDRSVEEVTSLIQGKTCIVVGPGLSSTESAQKVVEKVLIEAHCPVVLDADGLNCVVGKLDKLTGRQKHMVFTPHPGEMARLTGLSSNEIQANRVDAARNFSIKHNLWLVLKGAASISSSPGGEIYVNASGNPWMASGGQGDVLSGILGGLLAQGLGTQVAVPLGVFMHGTLADMIVNDHGARPVLAMDVVDRIPNYLSELARITFKTTG